MDEEMSNQRAVTAAMRSDAAGSCEKRKALMKSPHHVLAFALCAFISASTIASEVGTASKNTTSAVENQICRSDGTLDNLQARSPLICTDGKWRKLVFKTDSDGTEAPLSYKGKCSLRFEEEGDTNGTVILQPGQIADVCLPPGWNATMAAVSNSADWQVMRPKPIPNLILLKLMSKGSPSTMWVYPVKPDGAMGEKFKINLQPGK